jgi:hypothetical protein
MRRFHPVGILLPAALVVLLAAAAEMAATRSGSAPNPDIRELIDANERMTYEVRYGFLRLGNVHVYLKRDTVYRDTPAVHMVTEMISNRRIPLVGHREVHYHNFMAINDTIPYGLRFWQNSLHNDQMERYVFDFDYESGVVYSFEKGEPLDTLDLEQPSDGGPAVMYFARLFAGTDQKKTYPIFIDNEQSDIRLNFSSEKVSYSSPAFPDEDIKAYILDGYAGFDGPFGFSGDFAGFFKDDELRIPLEARVSIWVGSVRVRLTEYQRLN